MEWLITPAKERMLTGRTTLALTAAVVLSGGVVLGGCGTGASPGGSTTTTKSEACKKAQADIEKVSHYDAKTNPSPTISPAEAREVSRIIADNPTCFDPELVSQAQAALGRTPSGTPTTPNS